MERTFFAEEEWYRALEGPEEVYEGVIRKREGAVPLHRMRFNPWYLERPSGDAELYLGSHAGGLDDFRDAPVVITGKWLRFELEGAAVVKIAPARLVTAP